MRSPPSKNATSLSADTVDVRLVHAEEQKCHITVCRHSRRAASARRGTPFIHEFSCSQFEAVLCTYTFVVPTVPANLILLFLQSTTQLWQPCVFPLILRWVNKEVLLVSYRLLV